MLGHRVGKKTRKRQKKLDRALQTLKVRFQDNHFFSGAYELSNDVQKLFFVQITILLPIACKMLSYTKICFSSRFIAVFIPCLSIYVDYWARLFKTNDVFS